MPSATTLLINITQAAVTSSLRNRSVRQFVKDTDLRLEVGPLSTSWVLEYRPQACCRTIQSHLAKAIFGDVHRHTPSEARVEAGKADGNPFERMA